MAASAPKMVDMARSDETRFDDQGLIRMDDEACWGFLARHYLGRIGLIHYGSPMVFPVNYALDGRAIVFRTAPGTKLKLAASGTLVAFEVDEASELFETGTSVVAHGIMHEVTDRAEVERLRHLPLRIWAPGDRDHFVRIAPEHLTGRQIPSHQHDDGLDADAG
jgi:nitroimidazol reductase NimA-like FMN-containing flavoprotein (pyridoxamine 5'-phosphate oxidase superfamily)